MKNYMPLNGLRWSRDSGSANCDMLQSDVLGRPGGQLFLILCLRLYADNSDSLFEALADGFTS